MPGSTSAAANLPSLFYPLDIPIVCQRFALHNNDILRIDFVCMDDHLVENKY